MDIMGINHIAINTLNYEKTIQFYRDILGFEELNTVIRSEFRATYLKIPGGGRMEIFDNLGKTVCKKINDLDNGIKHIAFTVKDVKKHEDILVNKGVKILLNTTELPDFKARVILFYDPNGSVVEFTEDI